MNIVFFEIEDLEAGILLDLYGDVDYDRVKEPLTAANAGKYADAQVISTFIYSDLSRAVLEKMERLKFIATRSRSVDHIDMAYCAARGIRVSNVPAYGEHTVAEHVFALLLGLSRHLPQAVQQVKEGNFSLHGLQGFDLHGKTFGVIGTGAIGLHVADIARGFGMKVLGCDIRPRPELAALHGFSYVSLEELLRASDIISLHVAGEGTVLDTAQFGQMKPGMVLVNTARGDAIDTKALVAALKKGHVAAVGLDVLPDEPALRDDAEFFRESPTERHEAETLLTCHLLLRDRNVIITPHAAFYTRETVRAILKTAGDSIEAFLKGESLNAVVYTPPPVPAAAEK